MRPRSKRTAKPLVAAARRKALAPAQLEGAVKGRMPDFVEPCLATLVSEPPAGDQWAHEIKFDGYRIQARIENGRVRILTRKGLDWTNRFGLLPRLLGKLHGGSALIDGEVVVEDAEGFSSFSELADALKSGHADRCVLHCFDLLYLDGVNLLGAKLIDRKALLQALLARRSKAGHIRYSAHLAGDGTQILGEACRLGLEGIISKRADSPYRSGRHEDWLKSKCVLADEFAIIGYLDSSASTNAVGALVVGYYDGRRLIYAGRVGTGFSNQIAADLFRLLAPLRIATPPLEARLTSLQRKGVVWVQPKLVAQIEYRAWTADNLLRHAAFKGLREDKPAQEVRRPIARAR